LCELSSSTENASIADFAPRPGYSYYDAEVTNIKHLFWRIAQFDWLLTRQDIPVLPMQGQYAIFIALRGKQSQTAFQIRYIVFI
jgi:hypothetical protein